MLGYDKTRNSTDRRNGQVEWFTAVKKFSDIVCIRTKVLAFVCYKRLDPYRAAKRSAHPTEIHAGMIESAVGNPSETSL